MKNSRGTRGLSVALLLASVALVGASTPAGAAVKAESHEGGYGESGDCEYDGYCGDYQGSGSQEYDQNYGSRDDRNRSRNRNRGAFSPGPFDDSPVDAFNGNTICLPGSTCYTDDRQNPPPNQGRTGGE